MTKFIGKEKRRFHEYIGSSKCWYCGARLNYNPNSNKMATVDHKKALSNGGSDHDANKVSACYKCNQAKGKMRLETFRKVMATKHETPVLTYKFYGEKEDK